MPETLVVLPLPPLEWERSYWGGTVVLPAWAGFQARLADYGASSSESKSDGTTALQLVVPARKPVSPSSEQIAAYTYLLEHQVAIRDAILQTIFEHYPQWQDQYGYVADESEMCMSDIENPSQLNALMGLSIVRLFRASKQGLAYVGFEFGCTWDDEHGLGAMIHGTRVVKVGGADTAILEWIAEKDAQNQINNGSTR